MDGLRQGSAEWDHLLGAIELETGRAEQMEEMSKRILYLEKTLFNTNQQVFEGNLPSGEQHVPYNTESPSQQILDQTIRFLRRHPRLKHMAMSLLNGMWHCALKVKKIREGR